MKTPCTACLVVVTLAGAGVATPAQQPEREAESAALRRAPSPPESERVAKALAFLRGLDPAVPSPRPRRPVIERSTKKRAYAGRIEILAVQPTPTAVAPGTTVNVGVRYRVHDAKGAFRVAETYQFNGQNTGGVRTVEAEQVGRETFETTRTFRLDEIGTFRWSIVLSGDYPYLATPQRAHGEIEVRKPGGRFEIVEINTSPRTVELPANSYSTMDVRIRATYRVHSAAKRLAWHAHVLLVQPDGRESNISGRGEFQRFGVGEQKRDTYVATGSKAVGAPGTYSVRLTLSGYDGDEQAVERLVHEAKFTLVRK